MAGATDRLLVSPCRQARRQALEAWLVEQRVALGEGRVLIWCDNGPAQRRLNLELAEKYPCLCPLPARTTAGLADELLLRSGHFRQRPASQELLGHVGAVLADGGAELARYAPFAHRPTTCRALAETLARLRGEEPDPARWLPRWLDLIPHRAADLAALAALEQRLRQRLERHGKALGATLTQLAAELVEPGCLEPFKALLIWDLHWLSAADQALLTAVLNRAALCSRVAILPGEATDARRLFGGLKSLVESCLEAGLTLFNEPSVSPLADILFAPLPQPAPGRVTRLDVPTPRRGIIETLRRIKLDSTLEPGEVAVIVPDLHRWTDTIREEAERFGLGEVVAVVDGLSAGASRTVEQVRALLAVIAAEFPRRAVIELAQAPAAALLSEDRLTALDHVSRAAGLVGGPWPLWRAEIEQLATVLARDPERLSPVPPETLDAARAAVDELERFFGDVGPAHPARWRERLTGWLRAAAEPPADDAEPRPVGDDLPLINLAVLETWPESCRLPAHEYLALAEALLTPAGRGDKPAPGTLVVAPTVGQGVGAARRIYLLHALTGVLPSPPGATVPLDEDDLTRLGLQRARPGQSGWGAQAVDFLDAVTTADELILVLPATDAAGGEAQVSPFVEELLAVCGPVTVERVAASERIPPLGRVASADEWRLATLAATEPIAGVDEPLRDQAARAAVELARLAGEGGASDGCLTGAAAARCAAAYPPSRAFPPTGLEQYVTWPFRYFVTTVLGLQEDDEPTGRLDPRLEGQLLHRLLRRILAAGRPTPDEARETAARQIAEELAPFRQPGLPAALWRRVVERLAEWAVALIEQDSELVAGWPADRVPVHLEQRFGCPGGWPPINLGEGASRVLVRGVIDRLDRAATGWVIIDYKRTPEGNKNSLAETALQLPLYGLAVGQVTGEPVVGWGLIGYRRPTAQAATGMSPEAIAAAMDRAGTVVVEAVERLRAGQFPAAPPPREDPRRRDWRLWAAARVIEREETDDES